MKRIAQVLAATLLICAPPTVAAEATVAVATNFSDAMKRLAPSFESASGHRLTLVLGSSGKLAAQIQHGAPFDVFLSADTERPAALQAAGLAAETRFTYALGRIVLWSPDPLAFDDGPAYLAAGRFRHLAIANPRLAPYGAAARETLQHLGLWRSLRDRIVRTENIGQAYAFIASGAADTGFVASAQLTADRPGSRWLVPREWHTPIRQDALLLLRAADNLAARAFLEYLQSDAAHTVMEALGYDLP